MVAAGLLSTRASELRQASSQAPTTQEHAPLVADDAAHHPGQTPSAPVDPFMQADAANNRRAGLSEDQLCTICLDAPKDSFFDPCGHRCTCYSCGMKSVSATLDKFRFPSSVFDCMRLNGCILLVIYSTFSDSFPSDSYWVMNRYSVPSCVFYAMDYCLNLFLEANVELLLVAIPGFKEATLIGAQCVGKPSVLCEGFMMLSFNRCL
jgi:hypothetical protein